MNRIKELRIENDLTQAELGGILGVNQTAIGKYERGELEPNHQTLIKLADFFNCSLDYLLCRENDFGNVATADMELPADEQELLTNFRTLPREEKVQARSYVRYLADRRTDFTKKA